MLVRFYVQMECLEVALLRTVSAIAISRPRWPQPRPSRLDVSVRTLKGIGPKLSHAAAEMGLATVSDLLASVLRDEADFSALPPTTPGTVRRETSAPRTSSASTNRGSPSGRASALLGD